MRAVALSDPAVQKRITAEFVPLKVQIDFGTKEFPLKWPAMLSWRIAYSVAGGEKNNGFTGCTIVSPDLMVEYASTGSAMVWELFESTAYDAGKFLAMIERGVERAKTERRIQSDPNRTPAQRRFALRQEREKTRQMVSSEGRMRGAPPGFTREKAIELFRLAGSI
jgi:hypothetical protein